jgi:hypothetical protein
VKKMKMLKFGLATLVLLVLMPASPANADTGSLASCSGSWNVSFSRGVGLIPGESSFTTNGPTGTINCLGTVEGYPTTGPCTFAKQGRFEGSVLAGKGDGTISVHCPTTEGPKNVNFAFTMVTGPGLGFKFGESLFGPLTFVFHPTEGDGVTSPVTKISVVGAFLLKT